MGDNTDRLIDFLDTLAQTFLIAEMPVNALLAAAASARLIVLTDEVEQLRSENKRLRDQYNAKEDGNRAIDALHEALTRDGRKV